MKKFLLGLCIGIAALVVAVLILATNSKFQTWALKKTLEDAGKNYAIEFDSVGLGPKTVFVKNFTASKADGFRIKVADFQASYSLVDLLFSSKLNISELELSGAEIYVADKSSSATSAKEQVSENKQALETSSSGKEPKVKETLQQTKKAPFKFTGLPIDINIDSLNADVRTCNSTGTGLSVKASLKSFNMPKGKIPSKGALESALIVSYKGKSFSPVNISASILADKSAKDASKLNLKVSYKNKDMLLVSALVDSVLASFSGEIKADVSESDFSDIVPKEKLFKFSTQIYADIKADIQNNQVSANGALDILCGQPQRISEKLKSLNEVRLSGKFDVSNLQEGFSAKSLDFSLFTDSEKLAVLSLSAPISVKASTPQDIFLALPDGKIASLEINNLTDSLIAGITGMDSISFQPIRTQFGLYKVGKALRVSTDNPLRLNIAHIGDRNSPAITNLCLDISSQADFDSFKLSRIDASAVLINGSEKLKVSAGAVLKDEVADFYADLKGPLNPLIKAVPSAAKYGGLGLDANLSARANGLALSNITLQDALSVAEFSGEIFGDNKTKIFEASFKNQNGAARCDNLPVSLIAAFVPDLSGRYVRLNANFNVADGKISASGEASAKDISYGEILSGINPSFKFTVVKSSAETEVKVSDLSVSNSAAQFMMGNLNANLDSKFMPKSADAKFTAKLKALFDQPVLRAFNNIASGSAEFSANYKDYGLSMSLSALGLSAKSSSDTLEKLDISALCRFSDTFKFQSADIKFSTDGLNGKTSADGKFKHAEISEISIDAQAIVVDDMLAIPAFFSNPTAKEQKSTEANTQQPSTPKEEERGVAGRRKILRPYADAPAESKYDKKDSKAFWDCGFQALLKAGAKSVKKGGKEILKNVNLDAKLLDTSAAVSGFSADLRNSSMSASGTLSFDSALDLPYRLSNANLKIRELPVGDFIGGEEPIIEGDFDIDVSLAGGGANINHLLNHLYGKANVQSHGGIVRPLPKNTETGAMAEAAGTLLKIGSAFFGKKVKELDGISELAQMLSKFAYNKLELSALRDEKTYDIKIKSARLDAEDLFVEASGTVKYEPDKPIAEQQIDIPATIYVRENTKKQTLFESGGFAKSRSEYSGYLVGPKFRIYGTPSAVKTDLHDIISKATGAMGSSIFKSKDK